MTYEIAANRGINVKHFAMQLSLFGLALVCWELAVRSSGQSLVPAPSAVLTSLLELTRKGILLQDTADSMRRVLIGFSIASVSGITLGFAMGSIALMNLAFSPFLEFLRPIPPIAWIPLAMTIFGLGDQSACFVIFIGAFYPVLTNTLLGVREVPRMYLDAATLLGCRGWRLYRSIVWPAALPSIFAGLRVGLGFAWMCVVAAEMIAAESGLGYEIQLNRQLLRLDRVVVGMIMIGVVGFAMNRLLARLEMLLLPWRKPQIQIAEEEPTEKQAEQVALPTMKSAGSTVDFEHVNFAYSSGKSIACDIDLKIAPGEVFCLLGPSGCGKTTILRLISGLQQPTSGSILIDGRPLTTNQSDVTMVFQNAALFPWRTALSNIVFALESKMQKSQAAMEENAMQFLKAVGLAEKAHSYPHQLSGGQQQRVALARALAYQPKVLLMDEPFAALDSQTREALQQDLSVILNNSGITGIFVTHDIREAIFLANRVAVMSRIGGTLRTIEKIEKPQPRDDAFRYSTEFAASRLALWNSMKEASTI